MLFSHFTDEDTILWVNSLRSQLVILGFFHKLCSSLSHQGHIISFHVNIPLLKHSQFFFFYDALSSPNLFHKHPTCSCSLKLTLPLQLILLKLSWCREDFIYLYSFHAIWFKKSLPFSFILYIFSFLSSLNS